MEQGALIAMSGGVDSSVAAYLMLRDGWRCVGATMRLYRNEDLGLGLAFDRPMYVCGKDMAQNTVTLGPAEALYRRAITVGDVNWIAFPALAAPHRAAVQTRYHQTPQMALLEPRPDGCVRVTFDEPVRAAAPGQAAVFYDGDLVLGGGTIREPVSEEN